MPDECLLDGFADTLCTRRRYSDIPTFCSICRAARCTAGCEMPNDCQS
jgi:hypothetical protein